MRPVVLVILVTMLSTLCAVEDADGQHADVLMETFASPEALATYGSTHPEAMWIFSEERRHSIRRKDRLPAHWLTSATSSASGFHGDAQPGEFYVFQLAVYAHTMALGPVTIAFSALSRHAAAATPDATLPAWALTCFNAGGIDFRGKSFSTEVHVDLGRLQPLWIGVDIPVDASPGEYLGTATLSAPGTPSAVVPIGFTIAGPVLPEHGDLDSWRLSRLRWLNSTIGTGDDQVVAPFTAVTCDGMTVRVLGRSVDVGDLGLPAAISSYFTASNTSIGTDPVAILAKPQRFIIETATGPIAFPPAVVKFSTMQRGVVQWQAATSCFGVTIDASGRLEQDGYLRWSARVTSAHQIEVTDVRLESQYTAQASTYFMGLGHPGGRRPKAFTWSWTPSKNQDAYWIGAVNAGMKTRFLSDDSRTALVNAYYHFRELVPPAAWYNGGHGRISLAEQSDGTVVMSASSGARSLQPGVPLVFTVDCWITPFKPLDTVGQWSQRYFHPGQGVDDENLRDLSRVKAMGATVVNVHHNKDANPVLNYPYFDESLPILAKTVLDAHRNGLLLKIYYTTREITNNLPELWAFVSLGGEIICPGPGAGARPVTNGAGPHPWLVEHLRDNFIPAWHEVVGGRYHDLQDLTVITTPDSRLENFYLAGLDFTVRHADIDGLYIDDTAMGRNGFLRARRILDGHRLGGQIDMHSWNHFNDLAGDVSSALLFMQNFPYFNRLWLGEGFNCNHAAPDYWLVEMSGIPFGLMSEMLDSPNPWRGMTFAETARLGWSGDPRPLWQVWDRDDFAHCQVIGWWDRACPVRTGDPQMLATVYRRPGWAMVALATWHDQDAAANLQIDWKSLGIDQKLALIHAPAIPDFQPEANFQEGAAIPVTAGRGWLLELSEQK